MRIATSKSQKVMTLRRMGTFSLALSLLFGLFAAMPTTKARAAGGRMANISQGQTLGEIRAAIQDAIDRSPPDTIVVVRGSKVDAEGSFRLTIPEGMTVAWQATLSRIYYQTTGIFLILEGEGKFVVTGGTIRDPSRVAAVIHSDESVEIEVAGGSVISTSSQGCAISSTRSAVTVSDGSVEGDTAISCGGDVTVSGGMVIGSGSGSDLEEGKAINGRNITVTGGEIFGYQNAIVGSGTVTVTGGVIRAGLSAVKTGGAAAVLTGTCREGSLSVTESSALIVEVDTLTVPRSRGGGSDGLTVKAGSGAATWDTTGAEPQIVFPPTSWGTPRIQWGSYAAEAPPGSSFATAIPMTLNTPVSVSITDGDRQYYSFTPPSSGLYTFATSNIGSMSPYADLYDSGETRQAPVDNGEGHSFRLTYALTGGQLYYFVPSAWGYATGSYTMTVTTKTIAVGAQLGRLVPGTAETVAFPVTTSGITNGTYPAAVTNLPTGVSVQGQVTINNNSGTLTLAGSASTVAGTTSTLRLTIDGVQSEAFALSISASGAASTTPMANFVKANTYVRGQFSDVNESAWYGYDQQKVIASAFEYGLMQGNNATIFNPLGNVTVAEALAIAARVHSIYTTGTANFTQGIPWYSVYVEYTVRTGIIMSNDFADVSRPATRAEMAYIFSRALPQSEFAAQNTVNSLPDVTSATGYSEPIFLLYRAGVLAGSDAPGTFYPSNPITRAEAAAIITRVILPDSRWEGRTYG